MYRCRKALIRQWAFWSFAILAAAGSAVLVYPHDIAIRQVMLEVRDWPGDLRRAIAMAEFFAHGFGVTVIVGLIALLSRDKLRYVPRLAMTAFFAGSLANLIKLMVARQRPNSVDPSLVDIAETWSPTIQPSDPTDMLSGYAWQSFPSSHTATAIGLAIGLSYLFPRGRILFWIMAILGGIQRMVFDAHWPSDVVAGVAIGLLSGMCFHVRGTLGSRFFNWFESWCERRTNSGPYVSENPGLRKAA